MIPAPHLEIDVLVFGMADSAFGNFCSEDRAQDFAYAAIVGLTAVLGATFFLAPLRLAITVKGFWNFYTADALAIFFKRFALITTILVLIMMIDYAPVVGRSLDHRASNLRRILFSAGPDLCRADVSRFGRRFHLDLCLDRTGNDFFFRSRQLCPEKSGLT